MHDERINEIFKEFGVEFQGKGPKEHNPRNSSNPEQRNQDDLEALEKEAENYDPYNQLGYGWQAYFSTLNTFVWVFIGLTILMLPAFIYYAEYEGLKKVTHGYYNSIFMLGNMGFNKAVCISTYVTLNSAPTALACEAGVMSEIEYSGILPNNYPVEWKTHIYGYCNSAYSTDGITGYVNTDAATCTQNYLEAS